MGGGSRTTTQNTQQTLPANQQTNVDTLLRGALDYFNSGGRQFFPGDLIADQNANQIGGQDQIVNYAGGVGQDLVNDAIRGNQFFLDPNNIFNPGLIPGFNAASEGVTRGLTQNLTENILPNIRSSGIANGQFGGTPQGVGEGLAVDRTQSSIGDALAQLNLGAYGMGLNSFNQAANRAPGLFELGARPGQLQTAVGDAQQNQAQAEIGADVARHEFQQNEPIFLLELLRNLTGQAGTYGGQTTTTQTEKNSTSPVNQALGGALSLASLWNPMTSVFAGLGSKGAGIGAATARSLT